MKDLPYKVTTNKVIVGDAKSWCEQNFGPRWDPIGHRSGTWTVFWAGIKWQGHYEWFFKDQQSAALFALRWS